MKYMLLAGIVAFLLVGQAVAQEKIFPNYDSVLAKKTGADKYGMKMYVLAILTTGKATITEKSVRDSLFAGHMRNMGVLAKDGKLVVAGPFEKNDINYRGLFVFNTSSVEEARGFVATDPAVKAGIFEVIYLPWYCSAALMEVNEIHKKLQHSAF